MHIVKPPMGSVPKMFSFTKQFCPDCIIKLLVEFSMYGNTAQLFVSARSMLSFTVSDKTILFTNRDAFSITTTGGFLSRLLTASASKSVKVSKAQRLAIDRGVGEVLRLAVVTACNPKSQHVELHRGKVSTYHIQQIFS